MKTISEIELKEQYIHLSDNYFLEIMTQKTYSIIKDDVTGEYILLEPIQFEDNMQKIQLKVDNFIHKLEKNML